MKRSPLLYKTPNSRIRISLINGKHLNAWNVEPTKPNLAFEISIPTEVFLTLVHIANRPATKCAIRSRIPNPRFRQAFRKTTSERRQTIPTDDRYVSASYTLTSDNLQTCFTTMLERTNGLSSTEGGKGRSGRGKCNASNESNASIREAAW